MIKQNGLASRFFGNNQEQKEKERQEELIKQQQLQAIGMLEELEDEREKQKELLEKTKQGLGAAADGSGVIIKEGSGVEANASGVVTTNGTGVASEGSKVSAEGSGVLLVCDGSDDPLPPTNNNNNGILKSKRQQSRPMSNLRNNSLTADAAKRISLDLKAKQEANKAGVQWNDDISMKRICYYPESVKGDVFWTKEELEEFQYQAMIEQAGFLGKAIDFMGIGKWI
jgi:hypothetical protein